MKCNDNRKGAFELIESGFNDLKGCKLSAKQIKNNMAKIKKDIESANPGMRVFFTVTPRPGAEDLQ